MRDEQKTIPERIQVHMLHDGRVALELMSGWNTNLDLEMLRVDDSAAVSNVIQRWAAGECGEAQPSYIRQGAFPELGEAFRVSIGRSPSSELRRFTNLPERLCEEFALAFGASSQGDGSEAIRFADRLTSEMKEFLGRSKQKSQARLAGGAYLMVLEGYLADMRSRTQAEDQDYYLTVKTGVAEIMRDEQYLTLSADRRARELYREIQLEEGALYQWWMNLSKGDISGPR
ncbi:hypothetical protein QBL02_05645 [Leucobacter sp. UT-8R-CII-1-4]|uniref:hypothetical protein n=1 Tax=Leucobacter sp. UT-8R-CII-1-4 TaxID=3040075 RepID=UPI0024A995BA|nr:hypothetical protein [Leucobacter sp. UT-8R-CII-1-4]MDI6023024.1 hypothetical protein [Leucobacter sp. UT-8R-CII-1-4]